MRLIHYSWCRVCVCVCVCACGSVDQLSSQYAMMGLTPTVVCASFQLAALLLSATLDCARKLDKHHRTQMWLHNDVLLYIL